MDARLDPTSFSYYDKLNGYRNSFFRIIITPEHSLGSARFSRFNKVYFT